MFTGNNGNTLKVEPDFSEAHAGDAGMVRIQISGADVDTQDEVFDAQVYELFTPAEAREIARYFSEMADRAEKGEA